MIGASTLAGSKAVALFDWLGESEERTFSESELKESKKQRAMECKCSTSLRTI